MSWVSYLRIHVVMALSLAVFSPAGNAAIIFSDNFQSDSAELDGSTSDLDPAMGVGDVGGSWVTREPGGGSGPRFAQVINDTVPSPASGITGLNNYLKTTRTSSSGNSSRPHATGWDPSATANQLVQLDFSLFQTASGNLTLNMYDAVPPGTNVDNPSGTGIVLAAMDFAASIPDGEWVQVRLVFNTSATSTLVGPAYTYDPQTYSFNVNNGPLMDQAGNLVAQPQPLVLAGGATQFQSIMFKEGANNSQEYIDNVVLQSVPEPSIVTLTLMSLCGLGLVAGRTRGWTSSSRLLGKRS